MATYSPVPNIIQGDLATASWGNTYIRDNFIWFADDHDHSGDTGDGGGLDKTGIDLGSENTVTISGGSASITLIATAISAESGIYDVLNTLNGLSEGQVVPLRAKSGNVILVENGGNILCPKDQNILLTDDQYIMFYFNGSNYVILGICPQAEEQVSRTINLDSSMTVTDIRNIIEATDHFIPPGHILEFQFADGTYTLSDTLLIDGFYGGGELHILGNTSESGLHTNQAVFIDASGHNNDAVSLNEIQVKTRIENLEIYFDNRDNQDGINHKKSRNSHVSGCYLRAVDKSAGTGLSVGDASFAYIRDTYFSGAVSAIQASPESTVVSHNNDDIGTTPEYGLEATAGLIYKYGGLQPAGTTSNERTSLGGKIL